MAKDDMHIIAYKILRYLYKCNKEGKAPTFSDVFNVLEIPDISAKYLSRIMLELSNNGYAEGITAIHTKGGLIPTVRNDAGITLKGAEYLRENSSMKKAASIAGGGFELLLEGILSPMF